MTDTEQTANLENEALNAMTALVEEHGYSGQDLDGLVATAVENANG